MKMTKTDKEVLIDLIPISLVWVVSVALVIIFLRNFGVL